MIEAADIEVSIKCRIGIGKEFNYDFFCDFIDEVAKSGISIIYVHARNAILSGVTPKNNRTVPPLNYDFVTKIKKEYPYVQFILNGGIDSIEKALPLSKIHNGIMIGRLIQNNPFSLSNVDHLFYKTTSEESYMMRRMEAIVKILIEDYILQKSLPVRIITGHSSRMREIVINILMIH